MPAADQTMQSGYLGRSLPRVEDAALLAGQRPLPRRSAGHAPATLHAAILRSPHAHARMLRLDTAGGAGAARRRRGRHRRGRRRAVARRWWSACRRRSTAGRSPSIACAMSASRWRSSSPPDRYVAEDALELIEVDYEPLSAVVDPVARAATPTRRCCTTRSARNLANERRFPLRRSGGGLRRCGAPHRRRRSRYPRNSLHADRNLRRRRRVRSAARTPTTSLANFQGPFSHPSRSWRGR